MSLSNSVECYLFLGPMFSEKTTELIRHIKRASIAGFACLVVQYSEDVRYGLETALYTHDGNSFTGKMPNSGEIQLTKASMLMPLAKTIDTYSGSEKPIKVVAIDEGQFYPDLPEFVEYCMNRGITVYISALDGDYLRKPFGRISEVIPLATFITKLSGICMKCRSAYSSYTLRTIESSELKLIAGQDKYMCVCYTCYTQDSN